MKYKRIYIGHLFLPFPEHVNIHVGNEESGKVADIKQADTFCCRAKIDPIWAPVPWHLAVDQTKLKAAFRLVQSEEWQYIRYWYKFPDNIFQRAGYCERFLHG